ETTRPHRFVQEAQAKERPLGCQRIRLPAGREYVSVESHSNWSWAQELLPPVPADGRSGQWAAALSRRRPAVLAQTPNSWRAAVQAPWPTPVQWQRGHSAATAKHPAPIANAA